MKFALITEVPHLLSGGGVPPGTYEIQDSLFLMCVAALVLAASEWMLIFGEKKITKTIGIVLLAVSGVGFVIFSKMYWNGLLLEYSEPVARQKLISFIAKYVVFPFLWTEIWWKRR